MPRFLQALLLGLLTLSACAENPVTPEEHFEARGVEIIEADSLIVRVDSNRVSGRIVVDTVGAERTYALRFITEDGALGTPPKGDPAEEAFGLDIRIADTSVVRTTSLDDDRWEFRLIGQRAGVTSLTVLMLHGGHDDFVSIAIPVVVKP